MITYRLHSHDGCPLHYVDLVSRIMYRSRSRSLDGAYGFGSLITYGATDSCGDEGKSQHEYKTWSLQHEYKT